MRKISMAELNHGLTLYQIQLLAFAIVSAQKNSKAIFSKNECLIKFGLTELTNNQLSEDSRKLSMIKLNTRNLDNDRFGFTNLFSSVDYDKGLFTFTFTDEVLPQILRLKENYVLTDLTITSTKSVNYTSNVV